MRRFEWRLWVGRDAAAMQYSPLSSLTKQFRCLSARWAFCFVVGKIVIKLCVHLGLGLRWIRRNLIYWVQIYADCLQMNTCGTGKIESGYSVMICVWIMVFSLRRVTTSAEMQMNWRCIMQFPFFPTVHIFPTVLPPECNVNWGINNAKQLNSCAMQLILVQCARHCQCIGGALVGAALPQRGGRPSWHQPSRSHNRRLVSTTQASIKSTATSISRTTMLQCMALRDKSNCQVQS